MDANELEPELGRRRFLAGVGAGLCSAIAGCATPVAESDGEPTAASLAEPGSDADRAIDPSIYEDIYDATIDSVTFLRVFGIENPYTGDEDRGQGSGFLYDERHIVTNEHVVFGGDEIDVRYATGDWASTDLVGVDVHSDLAVLEVDRVPDAATPLALADRRPTVGQEVLAIGNPYGLEGSMTRGIVSGVNRAPLMPGRRFSIPNVVQTDAAVNPGNSGGPLVDLAGEVVGVVNAGGGDNIAFCSRASSARTARGA